MTLGTDLQELKTYCNRARAEALALEGVDKAEVTPSKDGEVVRLRYQGSAEQPDVYASLNFNADLGRPQRVQLMVYKARNL